MKSFTLLLGIFIIFTISSIEIVTSTETESAKVPESEHENESHSVILNWLFGRSETESEKEPHHTKEVPPGKDFTTQNPNPNPNTNTNTNTNNRTARQLLSPVQALLLQQQQQQQQQQIAAAALNQAIINRHLQNGDLDDSSEEDDDFDSDEFWDQSPLRKGNLGLLGTGGVRLYRSDEVIDEVADGRQGELNVTTTVSPITTGNVTTTVSPIMTGNLTTASPTTANLTTVAPSTSNLTTVAPSTGNLTTPSANLTTVNPTAGNLTTSKPLNLTMPTVSSPQPSNLTTPTANPILGNLTTMSMLGNLTTPLSNVSTTVSPVTDSSTITANPDSGKKPPYKDTLNCRCGMQEVRNENVGYANQEVDTYPWLVSIDSKSSHLCAGNIINSKFIITAASCVKKYEAKDLEIQAGLLSMNKTKFTVKKVFVHPEYDESTQANNLALLQVDETIRASAGIKFVCLPIATKPEIGAGTLVTWLESKGKVKGQRQLTLVQAQVQEVKEKRCQELLNNSTSNSGGGKLTPGTFCSAPPARNECGSDVGGGFLTHGKGYSFSLTGVISWTAGCKKDGVPAIHTSVQQYVRWILFKSQAGEFCKSPTFTHKDFSYLPE